MVLNTNFDSALYPLPERIKNLLKGLPLYVKENAQEIRLRAGRPILITAQNNLFVSKNQSVSESLPQNPLYIEAEELKEVLMAIANYSLYTRNEELKEGYLSMKGGHRAGICGNFSDGFFKNISSINIRIAKEKKECALPLYNKTKGGLLIAGGAGNGKTTVLRDLVRHLSNKGKRVSLIDTRGEIASCEKGIPTLDVGVNTDVINGTDKAKGAEIALRTMFPQIICFDEIGSKRELDLVSESFSSGVEIITTAHASSIEEIKNRKVTRELLLTGAIENIAILSLADSLKIETFSTEEVLTHVGI